MTHAETANEKSDAEQKDKCQQRHAFDATTDKWEQRRRVTPQIKNPNRHNYRE